MHVLFLHQNFPAQLGMIAGQMAREEDRQRTYFRNAGLLVDLVNCDLGYAPTRWQRDRLPPLFHSKVRTIFDGVDTTKWRPLPRQEGERRAGRFTIPAGVKLVTYVA